MKTELFCLCDFASAEPTGKMNVVGIFDAIYAMEAPAAHGLCSIAIKIRFGKAEEGLKKLRISFVDSDGNPVLPSMEMQIHVLVQAPAQSATVQVVSLIPQIRFSKFGEYSIDLAIDGRQEASIPLFVHQISPQQPHLQL
jgi:hypothetical protein